MARCFSLSISPGVGVVAAAEFVAGVLTVAGGFMPARKVFVAGFTAEGAGFVGCCAASLAAAASRAVRRAFLIARNFFMRSLRSRRLRSFSVRISRLLTESPSLNSLPFCGIRRLTLSQFAQKCSKAFPQELKPLTSRALLVGALRPCRRQALRIN